MIRASLRGPLLLLSISFVMICVIAHSFFPWGLPVHEDGKRTLIMTILYFEHAARELPLDIILGVAIGGAATLAFAPQQRRNIGRLWLYLTISIVVILIGSIATVGTTGLAENIIQSHTRPEAALRAGSHWYYHFLSRLNLIVMACAFGFLLRGLLERKPDYNLTPFWFGLFCFGLVSLGFLINPDLFVAAFVDPIFLGHQAREFVTHGLVTLPLAFWACARLDGQPRQKAFHADSLIKAAGLIALVTAFALYIALRAWLGGAVDEGQSVDIRVLIFPHLFEHTFTYLVTPLTAAAVFRTWGRVKT